MAGKTIGGVTITHPERRVFGEDGPTKGEVAAYYEVVAPWMLPELRGRPLSLVRCPQGSTGPCFFQKHHADTLGPHVKSVDIEEKDGDEAHYICVDDVRGVLELVQMNTLEFHPWGARVDRPGGIRPRDGAVGPDERDRPLDLTRQLGEHGAEGVRPEGGEGDRAGGAQRPGVPCVGVGGDPVGDEPRDRDERRPVRHLEQREAEPGARVDERLRRPGADHLRPEAEGRDAVRGETGDVGVGVLGRLGDQQHLAGRQERRRVRQVGAVRPRERCVQVAGGRRRQQAQGELRPREQLGEGRGHRAPSARVSIVGEAIVRRVHRLRGPSFLRFRT